MYHIGTPSRGSAFVVCVLLFAAMYAFKPDITHAQMPLLERLQEEVGARGLFLLRFDARSESAETPEVEREEPVSHEAYEPLDTSAEGATISAAPATTAAPPNLVGNGDFESGTPGNPTNWRRGGYGTNTRTFAYPVAGSGGGSAARVSISSYTSGDAKWYFNPVSVTEGTYTYSDQYIANRATYVTVQFTRTDGTNFYRDIAFPAAANNWTNVSVNFDVPAGVASVTVFHLVKGVGSLTLDNVSLARVSGQGGGIFDTGALTFRLDDGWKSHYDVAVPALNAAGFKGTFYIATRQMYEYGFIGYMSRAQVEEVAGMGHEIGAHTRTHRDLTTLSTADQRWEIEGSRQDLQTLNAGPISSFSYPFGAYTAETIQLVKNAGFSSAASTLDGLVEPNSDIYQLERQSVEVNTTVAQVRQWIDEAAGNKRWLILTFHSIDNSGGRYTTTPSNFQQIVDYVRQKGIPVVTMTEALGSL